ncbi:MAG: response regulator transcription factor [Spirosomataceae bacterium]
MATSLLIFEDNNQLRQSLQLLLNDGLFFTVKAAFDNCLTAAEVTQLHQPDLVVMDIDMPGRSGVEGLKAIKAVRPATKIIMFTVFDDDEQIFNCICAGADGYLLKHTPPARLMAALQEAMEGGSPMSPQVASKIFQHFRKEATPAQNYNLSEREKEILQHLIKGHGYKMIAAECFISLDTVKKHLKNIYTKLHVACGTEAVAKALRDRIVPV